MKDNLEETILTHDKLYCKSCDKTYNMEFIGTQIMFNKPYFDLYNCPNCHTTISSDLKLYYHNKYLKQNETK